MSEALDHVLAVRKVPGSTWLGTAMFTLHRAIREAPNAESRLALLADVQALVERELRGLARP